MEKWKTNKVQNSWRKKRIVKKKELKYNIIKIMKDQKEIIY